MPASNLPIDSGDADSRSLSEEDMQLLLAAADVRQNAHAPYSGFYVGAALRALDGTMTLGANIENASYGLTLCAERAACSAAVCRGVRHFSAIAIVSPGGVTPCGACRQFLLEFAPQLRVLVADPDKLSDARQWKLRDLLPESFSAAALPARQVPGDHA